MSQKKKKHESHGILWGVGEEGQRDIVQHVSTVLYDATWHQYSELRNWGLPNVSKEEEWQLLLHMSW
jgi:hypothetical protein